MDLPNSAKIRDAMELSLGKDPSPTRIPGLVEALLAREDWIRGWAREQLTVTAHRISRAVLLKARNDDPYQMLFPGFRLTSRLPLPEGTVEFRKASIAKLRQSIKAIRKKGHARDEPRIAKIQAVIDQMLPYAKGRSRALTVEMYTEMAASTMASETVRC